MWTMRLGNANRLATVVAVFFCAAGRLSAQPSEDDRQARRIETWVRELGDDQFLRRRSARKRLMQAGPEAVPALVEGMRSGDLEITHNAITVLQQIALDQRPDDEGGAWGALNGLARNGAGSRMTRAAAAIAEIQEIRSEQAIEALRDAGVFVGLDDFVVSTLRQNRLIIQIDENWNQDAEAVRWLKWIRGIEYARVMGPAIRRDVIQNLAKVPDLSTIALVEGDVTADAIEPLGSMQRIDSLEFRYVELDDALADRIMQLPVRVSLSLMGTGLAEKKVEFLREQLPGLQIEFKKGGFLGVTCTAIGPGDVTIDKVLADSAAERGGLKAGDEILSVDGKEVSRFQELQEAIGDHLHGEDVRIRYRRGNEQFSVVVKLGKLKGL
jgi:hypothetical protein